MGKILITGATGNVGGAALRALREKDTDVIAAVHDPAKVESVRGTGAEVRLLDYADPDSVARALEGVDRLFAMVPLHEDMRRWGSVLLHAAKEAGVSYVVRSSSMGADANAHYQLGKIQGGIDGEVEVLGFDFAVLRPATFMQNYLAYAPLLKRTGVLPVPEGKQATSFVDARDVGACVAQALLHPETYRGTVTMVTGPEALDNHQVAAILSGVSGREIVYQGGDIEATGLYLESQGMPEWDIHMQLSLHRHARNGYTGFLTKAVEHLTGRPATRFEDFAREHAQAWQ
ncbi:MAG: NmrA family NAD(P)-binding protein [Desulfovibrio sp.]|nr:NmrA family NAD(P)-binding protein [Desulfovibrio sp.]